MRDIDPRDRWSRKGMLIQPNGHVEEVSIRDFQSIQRCVNGIFTVLPIVGGALIPDDLSAYVNDEGVLLGMEVNILAMELTGYSYVAGPAVILGPVDDEGNTADIPSQVAKFIMEYAEENVYV